MESRESFINFNIIVLILIFLFSDEGQVFAFGSNFYGCLGSENCDDEVSSPCRIETFLRLPVQEVACGDNHVVALTKMGSVYTWGCGEFGKSKGFK